MKKIEINKHANSITFSPDGNTLASGGLDGVVYLWGVEDNSPLKISFPAFSDAADGDHSLESIAFSPDGKLLATGSQDKTARLWDLQGSQIAKMVGHQDWVRSVSFSPDGKLLLTGSDDGTARLWDLQGSQIAKMVGHNNWVRSVSFSPDGKLLATASDDGTAKLWDLQGHQIAEVGHGADSVWCVAFSPDGRRVVTGGRDHLVKLWDLRGNPLAIFPIHQDWVTDIKFISNLEMISSSADKSIAYHTLSSSSGNTSKIVGTREDTIWSLSMSSMRNLLAVASEDGKITVGNLTNIRMRTMMMMK